MCRYDDVHGKWYKRNAREDERGDALLQSFSTFGCRGDDAYWHYGCVPTLTSASQICLADDVWESILISHHERLFHYCSWWCCCKLRDWHTHPRCDEHLVHTHSLSLSHSLTNSLTIFIPHSLTHSQPITHSIVHPPERMTLAVERLIVSAPSPPVPTMSSSFPKTWRGLSIHEVTFREKLDLGYYDCLHPSLTANDSWFI